MKMAMQEVISNYSNVALNIVVILMVVLIFGGLVALIMFAWMRHKRFSQFKCIIWGKDGFGQITQRIDDAGIFVDSKTKNKRFFMKLANVGLEPDNVPYIQQGDKKFVYLMQSGLKNFKFIKPVVSDNSLVFDVGEEDVNWAINSYERQKKIFGENKLLQYLPFIILAFVCIVILLIFIYFFKQFPVLAEMSKNFAAAAQSLAMAQSHNATMVLPA